MSLELIYSENAKLLVELQSINQKLDKLGGAPDLSKALGAIVEKLEAIRDEIEECCENCNGGKGDGRVERQDEVEKLAQALRDPASDMARTFSSAGFATIDKVAGSPAIGVKKHAETIRRALKGHIGNPADVPDIRVVMDVVKLLRNDQARKSAS